METLPIDILESVLRDACTDGGYTGCALSLCSKSMREAALNARFHSIALKVDFRRLTSLLTLYETLSAGQGSSPRITHLYLALPERVAKGRTVDTDEDSESSEVDEEDEEDEAPALEGRCIAPLQKLVGLVADSLRTLVIDDVVAETDIVLFERPFARLLELTFVLHSDPLRIAARNMPAPLFPTLSHLTLVMDETSRKTHFATWVEHAPRVSHLCIASFPLPGPRRTDDRPDTHGVLTESAWPSLRHVVLQVPPPPRKHWCGTGRFAYYHGLTNLYRMVNKACTECGLDVQTMNSSQRRSTRNWREVVWTAWKQGLSVEEVVISEDASQEVDEA